MQIIPDDKIVRSSRKQDLKDFHSQFLAMQATNGDKLVL